MSKFDLRKAEKRFLATSVYVRVASYFLLLVGGYLWTAFFDEHSTFLDLRVKFRSAFYNSFRPDASLRKRDDTIVIVSIPENIMIEYQHPDITPRHYLADVIEKISGFQPKAIALDFIFEEPSEDDVRLAAAFKNAGNVIFGYQRVANISGYSASITETFKEFRKVAFSAGFVNLGNTDKNNVVRGYNFTINNEPSLSHEILACFSGLTPASFDDENGEIAISEESRRHLLDTYHLPENIFTTLTNINYIDRPQDLFSIYDSEELLASPLQMDRFWKAALKDKIVLIGAAYYGRDLYKTPFSPKEGPDDTYGVLLQALILKNIMDKDFIIKTPLWTDILLLALLIPLAFYAAYYMQIFAAFILSYGGIALFILFSFLSFSLWNYWPPVALISFCTFYTFLISLLVRLAQAQKDSHDMTEQLSSFMSYDLLLKYQEQYTEDAFSLSHQEVAMLICRLHFMPVLKADNSNKQIDTFLNYSFNTIKEAIYAGKGVVNILPPDTVLGFWNKSVVSDVYHEKAIAATEEIIARAELINRKAKKLFGQGNDVFVSILLHKCTVLEGYIGNQVYSIIGDSVDMALNQSRLSRNEKGNSICVSKKFSSQLEEKEIADLEKIGAISVKVQDLP